MKKEHIGEWVANAVSHGIGALLAVFALVLLILEADTSTELFSVLVFGISLITLYLASTLYHALPSHKPKLNAVFRRLDHCAIYLLIAGTYTPFILILVNNTKGLVLLGVLWSFALTGIVFKSIWLKRFKVVHIVLYVLMGWSIVFLWNDVQAVIPNLGLRLLFLGGISYTFGIVFYAMKFRYSHMVWHLFVLAGSLLHFLSIYNIM